MLSRQTMASSRCYLQFSFRVNWNQEYFHLYVMLLKIWPIWHLFALDWAVTLPVVTLVLMVLAMGISTSTTWRRGIVVSGVRRMNEVNPRRAWLVLGWVTVFGQVYYL